MVFAHSWIFLFAMSCILILPLVVVLDMINAMIDGDKQQSRNDLLQNDRDDQFDDN